MTPTTTCKYCASTEVPADLECIRMCDWCCENGADVLVDGRGPIAIWMVKRVLRRLRELREENASAEALYRLERGISLAEIESFHGLQRLIGS